MTGNEQAMPIEGKPEVRIKIAIDGPAASGKSTTAREVARRLGYLYIDSGAMYRAVTRKALDSGIPTDDDDRVADISDTILIEFRPNEQVTEIYVDGRDVSATIRLPEVTRAINPVAANRRVRENLVRMQKALGRNGGVVMDGRDITTVVFPDAELKVFMKASPEERARRRLRELADRNIPADYEAVLEDIKIRDHADVSRQHGPLRQADDAVIIDTTRLTFEEQVVQICDLAKKKIAKLARNGE